LKKNYSVDENPALGAQGLYYYYLTFTKALTAYGETLSPTQRQDPRLAADLMRKLVTLQKFEGFCKMKTIAGGKRPVLVTTTAC